MGHMVKVCAVVVCMMMLTGCLSAGTNARLCGDIGFLAKAAKAISSKIGSAVEDYTPKKCLNGGISGDTGNLTGGVNFGVSNESPTSTMTPE